MKKRNVIILACSLLAVLMLLASCMSSDRLSRNSLYDAPAEPQQDNGVYGGLSLSNYRNVVEESEADGGSGDKKEAAERYIVSKAWLELQTKKYDELNKSINAKLKELGGYVEASDEQNYESGRYESLIVRVPADKLDAFLNGMEEYATVTSKNVKNDDVTNEMIETGSRKKALEAEEKALLEILKKAQSIDEIITVQDRLSNVKSELESYTLKLQRLSNQVNYSTVTMSVQEVERIINPTQSFTALAGSGFMSSLKNVGAGLRGFAVWFVTAVPYFVLIAVIAVPAVLIVKRYRKRKKAQ